MKKLPKKRQNIDNSRKTLRKQKRQLKKIHRKEHYLKKGNIKEKSDFTPGKFVRRPDDQNHISQSKKRKPIISQDMFTVERLKEKNKEERLKAQMEEQRKKILFKANEEEDKIIKQLEKQLGLKKSKNKNNYFADDGLDYLLEICDKATTEQIVAAEKHLANVDGESDFEEDLAAVTGKNICETNMKNNRLKHDKEQSKEEFESDEYDSNESDVSSNEITSEIEVDHNLDFEDDADKTFKESPIKKAKNTEAPKSMNNEAKRNKSNKKDIIVSAENLSNVFSEDEVSHISDDEDDDGDENFSDKKSEVSQNPTTKEEKPEVWEDIYGRKRDKEGNVIKEEKSTYVPPHLRDKDASSDKQLVQLKRQIKSVLNKLAGTNLHWACSTIESLYSQHSRNSVNTALSELWTEATVAVSPTPDRLVAEHAALVSVLHANVATEIGAHFLQELSEKFDRMLQTPQPIGDKRLDNLVSCLAYLYSFKIYQAALLYDILNRLLEDMTEKNIDCVIVALRCVGGVLRKEEPLALKTFIHETQARAAQLTDQAEHGSRIKFLLEVLLAVKNNNLNKIPNYDPLYCEQLKKLTRGVIRKGNYVSPLNIRLEDLLKAEDRGKWWIVGSAWEGNRAPEQKPAVQKLAYDQKLLELARQQRMNTDVRRSIFCVIMSAEDYMDAFEKLQHLGLKGQQEREIVHVVLACCLQERGHNPYYALLARKLCDCDRKYQLSIQFSVWDKIKELESLSKQASSNLAQLLVHLIMDKALPLSVLKVIQFSDLNKSTVKFMRQILLAIIMNDELQASLEAFHRIAKSPKLHMFRESLKLFIQHFLVRNAGRKTSILSEDEMATLKERTLEVEKILSMFDSKLKL